MREREGGSYIETELDIELLCAAGCCCNFIVHLVIEFAVQATGQAPSVPICILLVYFFIEFLPKATGKLLRSGGVCASAESLSSASSASFVQCVSGKCFHFVSLNPASVRAIMCPCVGSFFYICMASDSIKFQSGDGAGKTKKFVLNATRCGCQAAAAWGSRRAWSALCSVLCARG